MHHFWMVVQVSLHQFCDNVFLPSCNSEQSAYIEQIARSNFSKCNIILPSSGINCDYIVAGNLNQLIDNNIKHTDTICNEIHRYSVINDSTSLNFFIS